MTRKYFAFSPSPGLKQTGIFAICMRIVTHILSILSHQEHLILSLHDSIECLTSPTLLEAVALIESSEGKVNSD